MLDVTTETTPLPLVAPAVGDAVAVQHDVLVELARGAAGLPPTWLMLPAGTEGTIVGHRDRGGESYAIVEIPVDRRLVVYVREHKLALVMRKAAPTPTSRRRPTLRHRR
jgi:hypothetical protein